MQKYYAVRWMTVIILMGVLITYCSSCSLGECYLEAKDVRFDKIIEVKYSSSIGLKISGQSFLSVRRISGIKVIEENDALVVFVSMSIINGKTGYFDYTIPIPNSVNEIKFGDKRTVIWKRGVGPAKKAFF